MKNKGSIAILGGMGPQASAMLLNLVVKKCTLNYQARNDADFPEIILNSIPIPDIIGDSSNEDLLIKILAKKIKMLEQFKPVCFGIACNTAHIILPDLQLKTTVPFVSIIETTSELVVKAGIKKVGLLATPTTINCKLYQNELSKKEVEVIIPTLKQRKLTENIIRRVLEGKTKISDVKQLISIANDLNKKGARGIILGCTELPLIFPATFSIPVFNTLDILADNLLKKYYRDK